MLISVHMQFLHVSNIDAYMTGENRLIGYDVDSSALVYHLMFFYFLRTTFFAAEKFENSFQNIESMFQMQKKCFRHKKSSETLFVHLKHFCASETLFASETYFQCFETYFQCFETCFQSFKTWQSSQRQKN